MCVEAGFGVAENGVMSAAEQGISDILATDGVKKGMTHDESGVGAAHTDDVVLVDEVVADGIGCLFARSEGQYQCAK